jgi:hypothetical protein
MNLEQDARKTLVLDRVRDVLGAYALVCTPTDQEDPP